MNDNKLNERIAIQGKGPNKPAPKTYQKDTNSIQLNKKQSKQPDKTTDQRA